MRPAYELAGLNARLRPADLVRPTNRQNALHLLSSPVCGQARDNERSAVERWRRTIKAGTETSCDPVLRVNAEMVELVYYQIL
jgi:hypothetical protein